MPLPVQSDGKPTALTLLNELVCRDAVFRNASPNMIRPMLHSLVASSKPGRMYLWEWWLATWLKGDDDPRAQVAVTAF